MPRLSDSGLRALVRVADEMAKNLADHEVSRDTAKIIRALTDEIILLRRLAPWHNRPRVQPHDEYGVPCRQGYLLDSWEGKSRVLLEGDHTPIEFDTERVHMIEEVETDGR